VTLKYKKCASFCDGALFTLLGKTAFGPGGELLLPWSYSGLEFKFRGRGIVIETGAHAADYCDYLRVEIDGAGVKYPVCGGNIKIVTPYVTDTEHTARIMRLTEGMESVTVKQIIAVGEDPAITCNTEKSKPSLMFIGDSITCGYGVDAPCDAPGFSPFEEDCTLTYAYMASRVLGYEILFTGASGKGIVANCEGNREDMTLVQAFDWETRYGGEWDAGGYSPEAVVVNAGTNDAWGGVTDGEFYPAGMAFLAKIRKKFPHAPILWAYGIMDTSKLPCIKKIIGDFDKANGNAYFLDCGCMADHANETGGGGHPNANTSLRVYPLLAEKLRSILGI
jgi:hypothetical protein